MLTASALDRSPMDRASTVLSEDRDEEGLGVWALTVADID